MKSEKLAISGGKRAVPPGAFTRYLLGPRERKAVLDLFDRSAAIGKAFDRYDGLGNVDAYERDFAQWLGRKYATAVSCGTAACHAALGALHLEPGSEVICSPVTDPGAVGPVLFQQCIPVFADCDPDTFNVSPASVERAITRRTKAILIAHMAGIPCRIAEIASIARKHKIPLIEDCAQTHGATYRNRLVGTFGDLAIFSMMSGKMQTSGGQGGMVLTDDKSLYWDSKRFADRGKPFNSSESTNLFLGMAYRMTELEAVVGRVQLRRLPSFVARRRKLAARLSRHLSRTGLFSLAPVPARGQGSYWFFVVKPDLARLSVNKYELARALNAEGVPIRADYLPPIYTQKWFRERRTFGSSGLPWTLPGVRKINYSHCCPVAEQSLSDLMILFFPECMQFSHLDAVGRAFSKVARAYAR